MEAMVWIASMGVAAVLVWLIARYHMRIEMSATHEKIMSEVLILTEKLANQIALTQEVKMEAATRLDKADNLQKDMQAEILALQKKNVELATRLEVEQKEASEKLHVLTLAREEFSQRFQILANQILEEKSQKFMAQNQLSLDTLLHPLQEKITAFQLQVANTYDKESKERLTLKNEIERLAKLNGQMHQDAIHLTQALKGNNKTQGIWGEMVLETVLESSGLRRGEEYQVQVSLEASLHTDATAEKNTYRPDVVIFLPENKHLIVDAKVSLVAYTGFMRAEKEEERQHYLKQHLHSVRNHIKSLSQKNYQHIASLNTPDFVMLFIAVEPAFMLAFNEDRSLFQDALAKNILLVSPSTLLANLRTIAYIWRQEKQQKNAQEIAQQCAKLYDKFVSFIEDLDDIGKRLAQTQKSVEEAKSKLSTGRGNLIRQVEQVKKLGVKPSKHLPKEWVDKALLEADEEISSPPSLET